MKYTENIASISLTPLTNGWLCTPGSSLHTSVLMFYIEIYLCLRIFIFVVVLRQDPAL